MKILIVTNMYPCPEQPAFGTFVKDQVESLERVGINVDILFVNGRRCVLNYLWGIFRLWWMLLKKRYDIIHAHYALTGFIARLQFSCPVVVTYHGGEVKNHVPTWLKYLALRGSKVFDRIIVVNRQEKEIINLDAKVRVIPCGVHFKAFKQIPLDEARHILGLPIGTPLILWAGEYWQYEKRFELVETSLTLLQQHCPNTKLILVSGKPHTVIPIYMSACDVLVLTSRSEGSPMVVKEAMACNLPIVSTDVGDVAEIIECVAGCYLVKPDPEDVADKLLRVLKQCQRTNGRDKVRWLDSDLIAQRIIAVYHELCPPERYSV